MQARSRCLPLAAVLGSKRPRQVPAAAKHLRMDYIYCAYTVFLQYNKILKYHKYRKTVKSICISISKGYSIYSVVLKQLKTAFLVYYKGV